MTAEAFWEILLDSVLDAVKILPVVFLIYVLIEFIESREIGGDKLKRTLSAKSAPLFGALIGVIPQCGFSVVATRLYKSGYILLGTLLAVYFATSDEALPILFSQAVTEPQIWIKIILLIGIKFCYALIVGFVINAIISRKNGRKEQISDHNDTNCDDEDEHEVGCCHHQVSSKRTHWKNIIVHPIIHSLKIFAYVFIINICFGLIIELIGQERITSFLDANLFLQPLFATLIGVIPNCASSVLITKMYGAGILSLGGAVAGLTINSGLGVAVLFKDVKNIKESLKIVGLMFVLSILIGYITEGVCLLFA